MQRQWYQVGLVGLAVAAITAVYSPAIGGAWLGDDVFLVQQNTCARGISAIPSIIAGDAGRCSYRPMRYISYAMDYSLWGLDPVGYHVTNLLIHLLSTAAVYLFVRRFQFGQLTALLGAFVWAIHPVQADAVAYISGRRDVLCGLGFFVAAWASLCLGQMPGDGKCSRKLRWGALIVVGTAISVFSKEMGVTLALLIPMLVVLAPYLDRCDADAIRIDTLRHQLRRWLILILPASLLGTAMAVWRGVIHPVSQIQGMLFGGTLERHLAMIFAIHARYLEITVAPIRLSGDYRPPVIPIPGSLMNPSALCGAAWLSILIVSICWCIHRRFYVMALGCSWYVITMLPVSHIVPHHEIAAEHYLYIPLVGFVIAGLAAFGHVANRLPKTWARPDVWWVGVLCLLGALSARTYARSGDYHNEKTHAAATVYWYPNSLRGQSRLGVAYLADDDLEAAKPHLEQVLAQETTRPERAEALRELGRFYVRHDRYKMGLKLLEEYIQQYPDNVDALETMGLAYLQTGQLDDTRRVTKRLLKVGSNRAYYALMLARIEARLDHAQQASHYLRKALQIRSDFLDALLFGLHFWRGRDKQNFERYRRRAERLAERHNRLDTYRRALGGDGSPGIAR